MAKQHVLIVVVVASIFHAATASSAEATPDNLTADAAATVYDVLAHNNLPRGLIPQGVRSYTLQPDGALEVNLPGECNFAVTVAGKQFKFRYGAKVNGVIKSGSISRVSGLRMQVAFAWLGFNQVERAGDQIKIQLETSTQSFPVSAFSQSPHCS